MELLLTPKAGARPEILAACNKYLKVRYRTGGSRGVVEARVECEAGWQRLCTAGTPCGLLRGVSSFYLSHHMPVSGRRH